MESKADSEDRILVFSLKKKITDSDVFIYPKQYKCTNEVNMLEFESKSVQRKLSVFWYSGNYNFCICKTVRNM